MSKVTFKVEPIVVKGNKIVNQAIKHNMLAQSSKKTQADKLKQQRNQMEIDDKLKREADMLKNLIDADEEDSKSTE